MNRSPKRAPCLPTRAAAVLCMVVALALAFPGAYAAPDDAQKRERQMLRRMQQQLNEVQQQKSALDQEKATLEAALNKAGGEADAHRQAAASAAARITRMERDAGTAAKEAAELRGLLEAAEKRNKELSARHEELQQDLKRTTTALEKQDEQTKLCERHNEELYRIGRELTDWYTGKGAVSAMLEAEPFTRIKRVQMENLLEAYRDQLDGQHLERSAN